jgi:hypothetical protein
VPVLVLSSFGIGLGLPRRDGSLYRIIHYSDYRLTVAQQWTQIQREHGCTAAWDCSVSPRGSTDRVATRHKSADLATDLSAVLWDSEAPMKAVHKFKQRNELDSVAVAQKSNCVMKRSSSRRRRCDRNFLWSCGWACSGVAIACNRYRILGKFNACIVVKVPMVFHVTKCISPRSGGRYLSFDMRNSKSSHLSTQLDCAHLGFP